LNQSLLSFRFHSYVKRNNEGDISFLEHDIFYCVIYSNERNAQLKGSNYYASNI
jgi:hypothetical protein